MTINPMVLAKLLVFNHDSDLEFAECEACGYEMNPPKGEDGWRYVYPDKCPMCKARFQAVDLED